MTPLFYFCVEKRLPNYRQVPSIIIIIIAPWWRLLFCTYLFPMRFHATRTTSSINIIFTALHSGTGSAFLIPPNKYDTRWQCYNIFKICMHYMHLHFLYSGTVMQNAKDGENIVSFFILRAISLFSFVPFPLNWSNPFDNAYFTVLCVACSKFWNTRPISISTLHWWIYSNTART